MSNIEDIMPESEKRLLPYTVGIMTALNHIACLAEALGQDHIQNKANEAAKEFMDDVCRVLPKQTRESGAEVNE
jgi:hypothetical protein